MPALRNGYEVLWTCLADVKLHADVCRESGSAAIMLETAVIQGTGPVRLGNAIQGELQPYVASLLSFEGWASGCGGYGVVLRGTRDVDSAIEVIGSVLRSRHLGDRVLIFRALAAAPAA